MRILNSNPVSLHRRAFGVLATVLLAGSLATVAMARQDRTQLRTVRGTVVDSSDEPLGNAVVYLKNLRTRSVRTYISSRDGRYRFSGLDPNVDYQIHAEVQGLTSSVRTVSSYDSRNEIVIQLKVDHKKAAT